MSHAKQKKAVFDFSLHLVLFVSIDTLLVVFVRGQVTKSPLFSLLYKKNLEEGEGVSGL